MADNKVCPHCGSKMFVAGITRGCVVEVTNNADDPFKLLKESAKGFEIEIVKCARCKTDLTMDDLVMGIACKECGKVVSPSELDENGVCDVCVAVKQRSDIANASREELIKMLLNAEKGVNPIAAKVEKQLQKAEEVENATVVPDDVLDDDTTEEQPKTKARRKPQNKKKVETPDSDASEKEATEAVAKEAPVTTEEVVEATNDLANSQDAPFPDVMADVMNPPVMEAVPVAEPTVEVAAETEQPVGAGFEMFPSDDEAF